MIAENKAEFFEQLNAELEKLGVEDNAELMSDLEEHFAEGERRGVPESEICRELGNIAAIARSCLDLKSSAINSMVARDVAHKKGVSLTKPGRSVPADPSLAAKNRESTENNPANEDVVRSYTPVHIREEEIPNSAPNVPPDLSGADSVPQGSGTASFAQSDTTNTSQNSTTNSSQNSTASSSQSNTESSSQSNTESSSQSNTANGGGAFEKIGRTVDDVCGKVGVALEEALNKAGQAVGKAGQTAGNAIGKAGDNVARTFSHDSLHRKRSSEHYSYSAKAKCSGIIDTSGLTPNTNSGRLVGELLLDIFLWIWLIPTFFSIVIAAYGGAIGLVGTGFLSIFGVDGFGSLNFVSRVLFAAGFFVLSTVVVRLAVWLTKLAVKLVKFIINRHIKAVYGI